ncbi:hypothetical protein Tco_1079676 [Tanacetum coccineum]|uniref:Uncharacterized protein n=1 Tax=Tanacetum coccineum TaxID=301880 RepID=A0ABQ5HSM0_9ASTR
MLGMEETASANWFVCLNSENSVSKVFSLWSNPNKDLKLGRSCSEELGTVAGVGFRLQHGLVGQVLRENSAVYLCVLMFINESYYGEHEVIPCIVLKHLVSPCDDEASYHEDASENGSATNKPKQHQQLTPTTTTISNIKLPILKKEEYAIWAMEMEHYLEYIDNDVWKVIQNGNSKKRISTRKDGVVRILPPVSPVEIHAVKKERKEITILLMAIPKEHLRRFYGMDDAKEIWEAIRTRFGGAGKKEQKQNCFLTMDDGVVNWGEHTVEEEESNHALMIINSNTEVSLCSKTCIDSYNKLKTLCDEQMNQLGDQEAQILAYSQAVKKLEAQLVTFQKQQLSLNEKLTFQANEIYEKDEKLKKYRRIGMKAVKEKEQLQKTLDSWKDSSKNLWRLINSGMSSNSKIGLGYEIKSNNEVLSYEEEMNFSVFKGTEEDSVRKPLYSRFIKANDFKGVPHPLSRDYTPKPQEEIDESLYVYGKKGPQEPEPIMGF